jgi:hypothetical protein
MFRRALPFNPARDIPNLIWWWDGSAKGSLVLGSDDTNATSRIVRRGGLIDAVNNPAVNYGMTPVIDPSTGRIRLDCGVHGGNTCMSPEKSLLPFNLTAASIVICGYKGGNNDNGAFYSLFGGETGFASLHGYAGTGDVYDDFGSTVRQHFPHVTNFIGTHIISTRATTGQWDFWVDGFREFSTTANTFSLAGSTAHGAQVPGVTAGVGFCECFLVGRYISDDEMFALIRYLAFKWKVSLRGYSFLRARASPT